MQFGFFRACQIIPRVTTESGILLGGIGLRATTEATTWSWTRQWTQTPLLSQYYYSTPAAVATEPASSAQAEAPLPGERTTSVLGPPSYLTIALPPKEGVIFKSEKYKMQPSKKEYNKPFKATVLWKKHPKTLMCAIKQRVLHPKYHKYYHLIKKMQVHDPYDECHPGDIVMLKQSRPISKCKHHVVASIYRRELTQGHLDQQPQDTMTTELSRLLEERKAAVRHSVVYMSEVQQLFLGRELRRMEDGIKNAREGALQAGQDRIDRLNAIREAKERDRQADLQRRRGKPRRSLQKLGRPERWSWDPYTLSRRLPDHWRD